MASAKSETKLSSSSFMHREAVFRVKSIFPQQISVFGVEMETKFSSVLYAISFVKTFASLFGKGLRKYFVE